MKERVQGTIDIESLDVNLKTRVVEAGATVLCRGERTVEAETLFDRNGTGYPGWDGIDNISMRIDSWDFYDKDGNETELSSEEQETAERQILLAAEENEDEIVWEY